MKERFAGVYAAAVADALDRRARHRQVLPHEIRPLASGMRVVGQAFTVEGGPDEIDDYDTTIRRVLRMLGEVPAGHVVVYACKHDSSAHIGELSISSLKARGAAGAVLDGGCRDVRYVLEEGFPVFSRFVTPEDSTWRWRLRTTQLPVTIGNVQIDPGDWIVGDDDGVVVVPQRIAGEVLEEAEAKVATESEIRAAVRDGMLPLDAYERYGTF